MRNVKLYGLNNATIIVHLPMLADGVASPLDELALGGGVTDLSSLSGDEGAVWRKTHMSKGSSLLLKQSFTLPLPLLQPLNIDDLMQKISNPSVIAMELHLFCIKPSIWSYIIWNFQSKQGLNTLSNMFWPDSQPLYLCCSISKRNFPWLHMKTKTIKKQQLDVEHRITLS